MKQIPLGNQIRRTLSSFFLVGIVLAIICLIVSAVIQFIIWSITDKTLAVGWFLYPSIVIVSLISLLCGVLEWTQVPVQEADVTEALASGEWLSGIEIIRRVERSYGKDDSMWYRATTVGLYNLLYDLEEKGVVEKRERTAQERGSDNPPDEFPRYKYRLVQTSGT